MSYYDRDKANAQPTMEWPKPHHGSVAEYATSGWPFVASGSTAASLTASITITFDYVTRWIQITNTGATDLAVSFADPAGIVPTTYYTVKTGAVSPRLELKCVKTFITSLDGAGASYSIVAGLTSIPAAGFPDISGLAGILHTV